MSILPMEVEDKPRNFVVGSLPTVMYIPDFITETEETQLLENVYKAPQSKWKSLKNRRLQNWGGIVHEKGLLPQDLPSWLTKITQRISEESGLFPSAINHVLINEYLPGQGIMPHQDGPAYFPVVAILSLGSPVVMDFTPHSSLRSCSSKPTISSEDANQDVGMWTDNHHPFSVALMPRGLLIFKDEAYSEYLHGIKDDAVHEINEEVVNEREALLGHGPDSGLEKAAPLEVMSSGDVKCIQRTKTRISLTCRVVLKVHKKLFKF
ncbi:alpha-ketoglutarate-dependent dioxygenase alkB homolog 6 isoform X1 [Punica granatum]|uniref:Alpha-ketoglutarate-dependent dioxygenase alkB homolog 6 isoform X1 n=3 Tax=Punica granatum TaxID=22663 RepID=A0A6P8DSE7_PUNGR|nr:alpha-ketoglutarate-dependent dioxygenase alkB homolog 6 isoform X1 [Punica granatum]